jgi:hypothetical protein
MRAGTRKSAGIRRRASVVRWQHLDDVLRSLGQDEPVQIAALADHGQSFGAPLIGHLIVPEITEQHAENPTRFVGRCRFTIPAVWGAAGCFTPHSTRPYRASSCASA